MKNKLSRKQVSDILENRVKLELNALYTEQPFQTTTGMDFGWFCREHSMHTYLLLTMLNFRPKIVRGNIHIQERTEFLSTLNGDGEHYWISVEGWAPIDTSLTLHFYSDKFTSDAVVLGYPILPDSIFEVHISPCEEFDVVYQQCLESKPRIIYIPSDTLCPSPMELIQHPYGFLSIPDNSPPLTEAIHSDIFTIITYHLYLLAKGRTSRFFTDPYRNNDWQRLVSEYSNKMDDISSALRKLSDM